MYKCVCAHVYVYSHTHIKHSPTKYKCIYIQMGKTPIASIEIVSINNQTLSNLNYKNRSHQSQYKEGIISTLSNRLTRADFAIKII